MIQNQEDERTERSFTINSASDPVPKRPCRVTVELPLFLVMATITLTSSAFSNIILYRTCVHTLGHSHEECKGFLSPIRTNDTKDLEGEVQKYATFVTSVKTSLESTVPAILSLFLGAWSDIYGRRPLIIWPIFGMVITSMLTVIYSMIYSLGPWWHILTSLPMSLSGGTVALFTGSYCYISDIAPADRMTLRMGLVDAGIALGIVSGSLLAKDLILSIGNEYLLLTGTTLTVLAFLYACFCVPESVNGVPQGGLSKLFDISLVKEMARECYKQRPNNGRAQFLLLMAVTMILVFVINGTSTLEYMYTRQKLHWALSDYNTYIAVGTAMSFFGGAIGIVVVQNLLGVGELMFSIFTVSSAAIDSFIKAFAVATWHMYLASVVSVFKALSMPLMRSYLTKNLPAEDIAKMFAIMCSLESIMPLIAPIAFNAVYTATINTFPGLFYSISGALTAIGIVLLGFVKYYASTVNRRSYDIVTQCK